MKKQFIIDTMNINNVNSNNKLFIAFSGVRDVSNLINYGRGIL